LKTMSTLGEQDKELAEVYVQRMGQLQVLFRFAQLMITNMMAQSGGTDFEEIKELLKSSKNKD
jgi:hypothetical protein